MVRRGELFLGLCQEGSRGRKASNQQGKDNNTEESTRHGLAGQSGECHRAVGDYILRLLLRLSLYDPGTMCRNIKTLFNFAPPATDEEIRDAATQFVRKLSGFSKPSKANVAAFDLAADEVTVVARRLLDSLVTTAEPRDREEFAERARARAQARFGVRAG